MTAQVLLGDARAIGHADEVEARCAERLAQRFEILDRLGGGVEARIGMLADLLETGARRGSRALDVEVQCFLLLGHGLAVERVRFAGAALVEQQDMPALACRPERSGHLWPGVDRRLAGPAGKVDDEVVVGRLRAADQGEAQVDLAAAGLGAVLRYLERCAVGFGGRCRVLAREFAGMELERTETEGFGIGRDPVAAARALLVCRAGRALLQRGVAEHHDHEESDDRDAFLLVHGKQSLEFVLY